MHVSDRFVKVFSLSSRSIIVVLASHNLEIWNVPILHEFCNGSLFTIRINGRASFPIILVTALKKLMIAYSIRRGLVYVADFVGVLCCSTSLVEELFVMSMIAVVIF